jgi:hypothetical protein
MATKWDADGIIKKYDRLYNRDANWRLLWQDVADYIIPKRSNILVKRTPGMKQTTKLYDSTAIHANELLAASMKQAITPANVQWFSLRIRNEELMKNDDIVKWLDDCAKKIFLGFHQSNFDSEVHELDLDLGGFGMGAMYSEETIPFTGFRFHTVAIGEYVIEENADEVVDTLIRKIQLTARAAFQRWGKDAGDRIVRAMDKNPEQYFNFLHMVTPLNKSFYQGYYVVLEGKTIPEKPKMYREFPYFVPRWGKTSGEENGRGPGFVAMPDVKTLNKAVQLELKALAKMIDPPIKQSDGGVIGVARLQPGGMTTVRPNAVFEAMQFKVDFATTQIKSESLKKSIRQVFYSDQLQLQEGPQMTAAESYIRYELMQRILGPTLGREEREFLNPLIRRQFGIMFRAGFFEPPPGELAGHEHEIDIEYEGTMAKAQRSSEVNALTDVLQISASVAQLHPEVFDWFDLDEMIHWLCDVRGIPKGLLKELDAVKKIRDDREKEGQVQQSKQEQMMIAEVIRKLTPALKAHVIRPGVVPGGMGTSGTGPQAMGPPSAGATGAGAGGIESAPQVGP